MLDYSREAKAKVSQLREAKAKVSQLREAKVPKLGDQACGEGASRPLD